MKNHRYSLNLQGFKEIITDGIHYTNAYSQQDGTLPFMASLMTGLYSSQHLIGDYEKPISLSQINENYGALSSILKSQGFLTDAMTPQGRLGYFIWMGSWLRFV